MTRSIQIGDKTPEFSLIGADGMIHTLVDYKGFKGVCFFFFSLSCKNSQKALEDVRVLKDLFRKKSIAFVGVCKKDENVSFSDSLKQLNDLHLNTDILLDSTSDLTSKFGVDVSPHFFIFNQSKHLIYSGRCKEDVDQSVSANNNSFIERALNELVGGLPISTPVSDATVSLHKEFASV